jgi:uncharacterized protein involved in response to NO
MMVKQLSRFFNLVCEEPYRLFFPLGILAGILGVGHWIFVSLGWIKTYSPFFHSSIQMQAYMACFVGGFLLTALPRFSSTPYASRREILTFLGCIAGITLFLIFRQWILAEMTFLAWLLALASFAVRRILRRRREVLPPTEFVWIPIAVIHGIVGTALELLGQLRILPAWSIGIGKPMLEQGFLTAVVLGVGGFLAPRLMGVYPLVQPSPIGSDGASRSARLRRVQIHFIGGALLFASFWLEGLGAKVLGYGLRACVVTAELFWTCRLYRSPRIADLFVRILWVSLWMVVIGSWAVALFPNYRAAALHLEFIGGFSLMTFAIGTMVILSHAGESNRLRESIWALWVVALGLSLALGLRAASVFFPEMYFQILGAAAALWVFASTGWLCFVTPRILKIPREGEFESCHEEAKQRVMRMSRF